MQHDYVGIIKTELLTTITDAPLMEPKDRYIEATLEKLFGEYDWSKSFQSKQILWYDEVLPSEVLIVIHKWLRRKCADIENILLITTHHLGISKWWKDWCENNHEKSFEIQEKFFINSPRWGDRFFKNVPPLPTVDFFVKNKNISRLFSFYGGSYAKHDREYLVLAMLKFFDVAEIEFMGKFSPKQILLDYAENILYYKDQLEIHYLSQVYDRFIVDGVLSRESIFSQKQIFQEKLNFTGRQWQVDRHCWASVVRETANDDFYPCLTEKTFRAFMNHVAVMPIGFGAVIEMEKLGFWFPHEIIDYSYQFEKIFSARVKGLTVALEKIHKLYSFERLQEHYLDNIEKFQHNAKLVYKYIENKESYQ